MGSAITGCVDGFVDAVPDFPIERCRPTPRARTQRRPQNVIVQEMSEQEMLEAARQGRKKDVAKRVTQLASPKGSPAVNLNQEQPLQKPPKPPKAEYQSPRGISDKEARKDAEQNKAADEALVERQRRNLADMTAAQYETYFRAMQWEPSIGTPEGYKAVPGGLYFDIVPSDGTFKSEKRVTIMVEEQEQREDGSAATPSKMTKSVNYWANTSDVRDNSDILREEDTIVDDIRPSFVLSDTLIEEARVS
eukprot:GEMP01037306.1.p1 GENE.GEMP01037306.1~~GEMP01037306.1.p1  ORF type:complete len:249 (+),score=60.12 GEMP01037306.1:121-867(+)